MSEEGVTIINGYNSGYSHSHSRSRSESPTAKPGETERPRRFLNGWSKDQERIMEEWSDIAKCYRWLHDISHKIYYSRTLWINIPVIILTTLGGTANFGIQSMFSDPWTRTTASFYIGSVSLVAGLLTTIGNYLRFPQLDESHRGAAITWGKFQRMIAVELAMNPNDRMDSMDFLKICRADLDRLIEQSPPIPKDAILLFEEKFGETPKLKKPDICGSLEHTHVFESSDARIKQMAMEGALLLKHKKRTLNELLSTQVQDTIKQQVDSQIADAIEKNRKKVENDIEAEKLEAQKAQEEFNRMADERKKKIIDEIEMEKEKMSINRSSRRSSSVDSGIDRVVNKPTTSTINHTKYSTMGTSVKRIQSLLPSVKPPSIQNLQSANVSVTGKSHMSQKNPNVILPEIKEPSPEDLKRSMEILIQKIKSHTLQQSPHKPHPQSQQLPQLPQQPQQLLQKIEQSQQLPQQSQQLPQQPQQLPQQPQQLPQQPQQLLQLPQQPQQLEQSQQSQQIEKNIIVIMPDPKQLETKEPEPEDLKRSIEIMIEK